MCWGIDSSLTRDTDRGGGAENAVIRTVTQQGSRLSRLGG